MERINRPDHHAAQAWDALKGRLSPTDILTMIPTQRNPYIQALGAAHKAHPERTEESLEVSAGLYSILTGENRVMADNPKNNRMLADAALLAGRTGELPFWRFVCLPKTRFNLDDSHFSGWDVKLREKRDDTLTPTLHRDKQILDRVADLGIATRLNLVLNDLEAASSRMQIKPPEHSFFSLPKTEQEEGIRQLATVRDTTTQWIGDVVGDRYPYDVRFVSSMVDFGEFTDLVEAQTLTLNPRSGVIAADQQFVSRINNGISPEREQQLIAARRVAQYGVEGSIIPENLPEGAVFLDSEPPVQLVWQKVTSINPNIPTLFYMTDADIARGGE